MKLKKMLIRLTPFVLVTQLFFPIFALGASNTEFITYDHTYLEEGVLFQATQSGEWGETTWDFDSSTGELIITGEGSLGDYTTSPWNQTVNPIEADIIKKITFSNNVKAPVNSDYLFSSPNNNKLVNLSTIEMEGYRDFSTPNVTNMHGMFEGCEQLTDDSLMAIYKLDTTDVVDLSNMFKDCESLTELRLTGFNTGNVTNMSGMFYNCIQLKVADIPSFYCVNVTDMSDMFSGCTSLEAFSSPYYAPNLINVSGMFRECESIEDIRLVTLYTDNVTNMSEMFSGCNNLKILYINELDTSSVATMSNMFNECNNLALINLGNKFRFQSNCALPEIDPTNVQYSGKWENDSDGTVYTSTDNLINKYNGSFPGVYVWQSNPTD